MATLNITADDLGTLNDMKNAGQIAEAWNFLGSKGDAYAYLAGAIVWSNVSAMSPIARIFYEMVRSRLKGPRLKGPRSNCFQKDGSPRDGINCIRIVVTAGPGGDSSHTPTAGSVRRARKTIQRRAL